MQLVFFISIVSLLTILSSVIYEIYIFNNAPFLKNESFLKDENKPEILNTSLSVIIPTYNEEINIQNCLSALSKIKIPCEQFNIIVSDDCSTDNTLLIARKFKEQFSKNKIILEIITSGERPKDKNWVGKNWPCYKGSKKVKSEWILFIDADVVVGKFCILNALSKAYQDQIDLLSLAPKVNCNCFTEWIVQPIMTSLLMIGFPISNTNNPDSKTSFAAGPFMLFKRSSYEKIGGHKGTYNKIVEDLALAKKIKEENLKLNFLIAIEDISLNMYKDLNSLLEGWSKNWFLGLGKNIFKSFAASIFVFTIYVIPWIFLFFSSFLLLINNHALINIYIFIICLLGILSYGLKRYWLNYRFKIPYKFWFLNWLGGIVVIYISLLSIYKTFTGLNWTWKGRSLSN
tara:strand:+ start:5415 stop:6617 length:1203 start_codon:yes stop_codon:yes gene_type:complete